jgi:hypothetical protein
VDSRDIGTSGHNGPQKAAGRSMSRQRARQSGPCVEGIPLVTVEGPLLRYGCPSLAIGPSSAKHDVTDHGMASAAFVSIPGCARQGSVDGHNSASISTSNGICNL